MIEDLSNEELEIMAGGSDDGIPVHIGIWDEWKWPPRPPHFDLDE